MEKILAESELLIGYEENYLSDISVFRTEILQKIQAAVDFEPDVVDSDPKILISMVSSW